MAAAANMQRLLGGPRAGFRPGGWSTATTVFLSPARRNATRSLQEELKSNAASAIAPFGRLFPKLPSRTMAGGFENRRVATASPASRPGRCVVPSDPTAAPSPRLRGKSARSLEATRIHGQPPLRRSCACHRMSGSATCKPANAPRQSRLQQAPAGEPRTVQLLSTTDLSSSQTILCSAALEPNSTDGCRTKHIIIPQ